MNHHTTNAPPLLSSHLQSFNTWYINTFFPVLSVWVILEVFILPDVQQKKKIWPKVWIDHAFTFYCGFGLLGNKMALPQSQILTIPQWFLLLSGSHIVVITFFFLRELLLYFTHFTNFVFYQNIKTDFCLRFVPMEYITPMKETSTKVLYCHKNWL